MSTKRTIVDEIKKAIDHANANPPRKSWFSRLPPEGQQEMLDADPGFKMTGIIADAPLAHFRRVLQRRIDAERASREAGGPRVVPVTARPA